MSDHGEYCGPIVSLKGEKAIVRPHPNREDVLLAQFDGKEDWRLPGEFKMKHPETGAFLCVGWHEFSIRDFKLVVRVYAG